MEYTPISKEDLKRRRYRLTKLSYLRELVKYERRKTIALESIAKNITKIKELLEKKEPSDLIDAIERYNQEFIDDLTAHLTGKKATHDKHEEVPYSCQENADA